ncbi:MAG: hypothetical protein VX327_07585 [Actinomycetota bacterium]|nr:hypothetical protein [Actinomycetota bacterium]
MRSEATSVDEYLEELPDDRRGDLEVVRDSMLAAVPSGVVETMNWGMVSYEIPLERYPDYLHRPAVAVRRLGQPETTHGHLSALHPHGANDSPGFRGRVRGIRLANGYRKVMRALHTFGAAAA